MESVEIEGDDQHCVICLEDWEIGEKVKEMPCKHRFCKGCIEKWLRAHGSCPVCRYEMPVEEDEDGDGKMGRSEEDGERMRGIWVGFAFSRD
ncbi:E3 ubiquitin-protein ligase ring1 [Phtheirospermum japonicum]|uniref:E3 ubiquitin-protein ligase ring1 n=1 Tax=Phtheirospermum japonicum TaxID=374723 RepID=A0A830BNT7_9LAMI|nr:E3 ubiquitin-protein ligase ring1 [Phtheirospermum japonicum]